MAIRMCRSHYNNSACAYYYVHVSSEVSYYYLPSCGCTLSQT